MSATVLIPIADKASARTSLKPVVDWRGEEREVEIDLVKILALIQTEEIQIILEGK